MSSATKTIRAIFEDGVFRPTQPVDLPDHCEVEFEPRPLATSDEAAAALRRVYSILAERYESGERDVAARHEEHQP